MAIYLGRTSPSGSSSLPEGRRAALRLLFGLASDGVYMCPACCQAGGSLLHCLSTLTGAVPAVYFCCTVPGVASARRYLAPCPVKPGLSSPAAFRPCGSDHLSYLNCIYFSRNQQACQLRDSQGQEPPFITSYSSHGGENQNNGTCITPVYLFSQALSDISF